jgi:hypothetical protein
LEGAHGLPIRRRCAGPAVEEIDRSHRAGGPIGAAKCRTAGVLATSLALRVARSDRAATAVRRARARCCAPALALPGLGRGAACRGRRSWITGSQFRTGASGVDAPPPLSQRAKRRSHLLARVDRPLKVARSLTQCTPRPTWTLTSGPSGTSKRMRWYRARLAGTKYRITRPGICQKPGGRSCSQP